MPLVFHGPNRSSPNWTTAFAPTRDEIARLRELGFDAESLEHALDPHERPRVRVLPSGQFFVVLRAPIPSAGDIPFVTIPLAFIVDKERGLTIGREPPPLAAALTEATDSECREAPRMRVVLRALELTADAYLAQLDEIDAQVDRTEDKLQRSLGNREVLELLRYQKALVHFSDALESMRMMLERLQRVPGLVDGDADRALLEDAVIELHQAHEMANMSRSVLSEMMDAFASIISNNLNVVMKWLASFTVLLTVPVLVASFYGMNVALPAQKSPHAFWWLAAISLVAAAILGAIFRGRRWL